MEEVIVSVYDLERHEMLQLAEERFEWGKKEIEHGKQLLEAAQSWFNEDGTKKPEHPKYQDSER